VELGADNGPSAGRTPALLEARIISAVLDRQTDAETTR
jgi:hypothetical protein